MSELNPHLDRQIIGYARPKYFKLFIVHCALHEARKATMINDILESFIQKNFTEKQQMEMLTLYELLSDDEKKKPENYWKRMDKQRSVIIEHKNGKQMIRPNIPTR